MKHTLLNMSVIDALRKLPDESVDCVVSSPPYYALRDYSGVATYSADSVDKVNEIAKIDLLNHRDRVPDHQKSRYYLTSPVFNEKKKKWYVSLKYDVSEIWGGNPECEHEWNDYFRKGQSGGKESEKVKTTKIDGVENFQAFAGEQQSVCHRCGAWKGQLGLEPTYKMYIDHLMLVMRELKRVLKKTGTLFWNMGDTYSGAGAGQKDTGKASYDADDFRQFTVKSDLPDKSLTMIPERFAMAMIDDGWTLRNSIIWYKRNGMPSSVKDRFSNKWEYVFFFTKSRKYYFDLDSIRKPLEESSIKRVSQKNIPNQLKLGKSVDFAETDPVNNIPKILNNMHKKYNGANTGMNNKEPYKQNNPHLMRLNANKEFFNEKGQGGHVDYNGIDSEYGNHYNENGANPGDVIYNSKYSNDEYGQTLQGFTRNHTIEKAREQSYIDAKRLYPNDTLKQKEYIKNIHDHLGNPNGANPGDVMVPEEKPYAIAERDKDYIEYRNLPPLEEVSEFLNKYRKELGYTIDQIESKMNSQAPHHWFNAESYPSSDDWKSIKDILMFPDTYDKAMTEVFLKPSEKQNDPNGANPGDVISQPAVRYKSWQSNAGHNFTHERKYDPDADGGDFLDIPTRSHSFAHFAVFPETLVEPFIKAGCPSEVCVKCGKPKIMQYKRKEYIGNEKPLSGKHVMDKSVNSPGNREHYFTNIREYDADQKEIALFIKKYITDDKLPLLDSKFGETKWKHWIRTDDSGGALPSPSEYRELKDILNLPNDHDDEMLNTVKVLVDDSGDKEIPIGFKPSCKCDADFEPGTVLDPFAGSGTVGVVATKHNKNSILIEVSPEYCKIIKKRLNWRMGLDVEYEHVAGETVK